MPLLIYQGQTIKIYFMKKKVLLFALFILSVQLIIAQTQRRVLVEEATNASCYPCGQQNPAFDALLQQNPDKVAVIKYHASWPGYDPMYNHNTVDNGYRISFYGINGVPTAVMDGTYSNSPASFSQALIDQYYAIPAPFEMDMYHYLSEDQDSMYVITRIRAAQDIDEDNLRAFVVINEKHVHFNSPPGSNGETDFYDVMKKILPQKSGIPIHSQWEEGEYIIMLNAWELENVYDIDELTAVGFVQDYDNKDAKQAAVSSETPFEAVYAHDASMISISNLTETNCMGYAEPEVTIANFGADNLTSVDIKYHVNDGSTSIYNWTGNLESLETTTVLLPGIDFDVQDENELTVYVENPNGTADQYPANDAKTYTFDAAITTPNEVKLMISMDSNPGDITWDVKDSNGEVVFEGGPYTQPNTLVEENMIYDESGCYIFTIHDSQGDGLQPPGFFALYYGSGTQIISGTAFGSEKKGQYSVDATVGLEDNFLQVSTILEIYPNPAQDAVAIDLQLINQEKISISLMNNLGQMVEQIFHGDLSEGKHVISADLSGIEKGMYFIRLKGTTLYEVRKIFIQ